MDRTMRVAVGLVLAAALSVATPVVALADPGIDATVGSATIDSPSLSGSPVAVTSEGTVTVATTGTTATVSAPATTASLGSPTVTAPDLSAPSTGTGGVSVTGALVAPGSSSTSVRSGPTSGPGATATAAERLSQGLGASVTGDDGLTRTSVRAGAVANAVICLLADLNALPADARVSSLCASDASTAVGGAEVTASNGIAGATVGSGAALGAAVCLLGLVSSPIPGSNSAAVSLTSVCGGAPSTFDAGGTAGTTSERTGTSLSAAPIVSAAVCLIANGTVGLQTVASLSTMCASAAGGSPSIAGGSAVISATDATTSSHGDLAPAANAAACLLLNALATAGDPSASASLGTACGANGSPTPSAVGGGAPAGVTVLGVSTDPAPAVDAAICILTNAQAGTSGGSASIADACPAGPATPSGVVGGVSTPPTDRSTAPSEGVVPAVGGVTTPGTGLAALPSSATATAGLGLFVATLMALAALGRRRRR